MLSFRRFSKQWYWQSNKKIGAKDDICITSDAKDGGVYWEFSIKQIDFSRTSRSSALKIQIFDDAVKALRNKKVVNMLIAMEGVSTLDEAEIVLREHKFKEKIDLC
jgi:hypothetical protein